jgi:hypothetical protein
VGQIIGVEVRQESATVALGGPDGQVARDSRTRVGPGAHHGHSAVHPLGLVAQEFRGSRGRRGVIDQVHPP